MYVNYSQQQPATGFGNYGMNSAPTYTTPTANTAPNLQNHFDVILSYYLHITRSMDLKIYFLNELFSMPILIVVSKKKGKLYFPSRISSYQIL